MPIDMYKEIFSKYTNDNDLEKHIKLNLADAEQLVKLVDNEGLTLLHHVADKNWSNSASSMIDAVSPQSREYWLLKRTFKTGNTFNPDQALYDSYYTPIELAHKRGHKKMVSLLSKALLLSANAEIKIDIQNQKTHFQIRQKAASNILKAVLAIECNDMIESANFSRLRLDFKETGLIASMLKKNPALTSLDLSDTAIGGSGIFVSKPAWPIVVAVKENTKLTKLDLARTRLSSREGNKLLEAIEHRAERGLVRLDLEVTGNPEVQRLTC